MLRMRIGLALPHYGFSFPPGERLSWPGLVDSAVRAERLGFDSLWISDHFFLDLARYGGPQEPLASFEPFTALAALAALTERVRLGTLVVGAPFRHPALLAKMATAVDVASGGRLDLGIGAGWYEREFRAFGYPFETVGERFALLEDTVEAVAALFGAGPVELVNRHVRLSGAFNRPGPVQEGGPPIWIGGKGGDRGLRLVARHAAGWNTVWRWTPEAHGERVRRLRQISQGVGRDPSTVRLSVGLYALVGEDESDLSARFEVLRRWTPGGALAGVALAGWAEDTLTGTVERCLERLARFAENGVEEMILSPASLPFAVYDWSQLDLIAERIIPAARDL